MDDLLLVGVGGGAARFVCETASRSVPGLKAVVFDSDARAVPEDAAVDFRLVGAARLEGRGTGGDTIKGRAALQDDADIVSGAIAGVKLAIVVVSLGGGFGGGATPEILRAMRAKGVTTLCVATTPFGFEGDDRKSSANKQATLIEDAADTFTFIPLDTLFACGPEARLGDAFAAASSRMADVLSLFWIVVAKPGFISVGVERMLSVISGTGGKCFLSLAAATGPGRAATAVNALFDSGMLSVGYKPDSTGTVLLGIVAGEDLRLAELTEATNAFKTHLPSGSSLCFGTVLDDARSGDIKIVSVFFCGRGESLNEELAVDILPQHSGRRSLRKDSQALGASGGGRFKGVEGTIYEGQDLDIPTYLRRNLPLDK